MATLDEYEKVDNNVKIMLRAVISEIIDRLMVDGFVYMQRWVPQMCGVDPTNRYGDGLDPERVNKLLLAIFRAGWSWEEAKQAICREVGPKEQTALDFQVELSLDSDEMIAPVNVDNMKKIRCLTATRQQPWHASLQGLRSTWRGCKCFVTTAACRS